jgi:hypothetical protein
MKIKPLVIIIITLAIGVALGILISAQIRYHRLKPVRIFFSEQRFREGFYNVIQPDEKQKETIDKLLSRYARENSFFQNDFRKKLDSLMKEFWKELNPLLTKEQQDRLKEMEKKRNEMFRQNRRPQDDTLRYRGRMHRMPPPPGEGEPRPPFHEKDSKRLE